MTEGIPKPTAEEGPENLSWEQMENNSKYKSILNAAALEYLKTADSGSFGREFSGELDSEGYLLKKDGTNSNTTPSMNIGGGIAMEKVLELARAKIKSEEAEVDTSYADMAEGKLNQPPQVAPEATPAAVGPSVVEMQAADAVRTEQALAAIKERLHIPSQEAHKGVLAPESAPQLSYEQWKPIYEKESAANTVKWGERVGEFENTVAAAASAEELKGVIDTFALDFTPLPGVLSEKNIYSESGWLDADRMKGLIDSYVEQQDAGVRADLSDEGFEGTVLSRLQELTRSVERPSTASALEVASVTEKDPVQHDREHLDFEQFMYRHGTHKMNAEQVRQLLGSRLQNRLESITKALVGPYYNFEILNDSEKKEIAQSVLSDPDFAREVRDGHITPELKTKLEALTIQKAA